MARISCKFCCLLSVLVIQAGCTSYYWTKAGSTQQDWEIDSTECRVMASRNVPPDIQSIQTSSGYRNPQSTNCYNYGGGMIQCSTTGGEYIPPTRYSYDANESLRSKAAEACLYRKGWQKISSEEYEARKPKLMTPSNLQVPERTKSEGSSCITASECAGNLLCLGGVCSYFKKAGELCNHTQQCEGKLQCNNGRCAMPETVAKPKLLEGSSCISTDECQSGLQCQLGRCRIPQTKHLGQPCNSTTECIGDTLCITGRCALRGKIGNDCKFTYECEGALQCKSGKCTSN